MPASPHPRFACDAMLGGLARWLRAAGYEASWHDGDVFEFAHVRDGVVPALFVPRGLTIQDQLAHVVRGMDLPCGSHGAWLGAANWLNWHRRRAGAGTHWERIVGRLQDAAC